MKPSLTLTLISLLTIGVNIVTEAKTVIPPEPLVPIVQQLKAGSWKISYYQGPNETKVTRTSTFCVRSDSTWSIAGPITIPGNGGWSRDGNDITLYGTVGEAIQGSAFTAIGHVLGETLITGRYVNFDIIQNAPNGDSGSFKASFLGSVCPF